MIRASTSNVQWDKKNRSVTDDAAAQALANGHPKSTPPLLQDAPGMGSAPGANGPPTTGALGEPILI